LGASNLLEGKVQSHDGAHTRIELVTGETVLVPTDRVPDGGSGPLSVGVRPEKLQVSRDAGSGPGNRLTARVMESSYTGVSTSYRLEARGGSVLVAYVQNLDGGEVDLQKGDEVVLSWAPEHTFVIRGESGGGER
jgi:spermidine/putrescine transport system ATP-binding protein